MRNRPRPNFRNKPDHPYNQRVLSVDRVSRVVKGGRRFRFRALVVLGDGKGLLGVGSAKGTDVASAITKAANVAKKGMRPVVLAEPTTIPHDVRAKVGGAHILLKPAKEGTGLIAGSVTRDILEVAGYHNIYSKSLGNSNKVNLAYAVMAALSQLVAQEEWHLSRLRDEAAGKPAAKAPAKTAGKPAGGEKR